MCLLGIFLGDFGPHAFLLVIDERYFYLAGFAYLKPYNKQLIILIARILL